MMDSAVDQLCAQIPSTLPPEWPKCSPISDGVIGDLFVVFKSPLGQNYKLQQSSLRFTPQMVFDTVQIQGHGRIKLWINLTSTRNYEISEVTDNDADYTQFCTVKSDSRYEGFPCQEDVLVFTEKCNHFLATRQNSRQLIGVHSTLGFNRTGYFISSYLKSCTPGGRSLEDILREYRLKRPNGIHKLAYVHDLIQRFGIEYLVEGLQMLQPAWLLQQNRAQIKENPTFFITNPEIANPVQDSMIAAEIRQEVQKICGSKRGGFPGRTLVTFSMETLHYLQDLNYYIGPKADGRRYLLYINDKCQAFFMDRETSVFSICANQQPGMISLWRYWFGPGLTVLQNSLLDGELIVDKSGKPSFFIFDVLQHGDKNLTHFGFGARLEYLNKSRVIEALSQLSTDLKFSMCLFQDIAQIEYVFTTMENNATDRGGIGEGKFEYDGIVFENVDEKYISGSVCTALKWKPNDQSTVDFRMEISPDRTFGKLYVASLLVPLGNIAITEKLADLDGRIIECYYERKDKEWKFLRERPERINPNEYHTAMEVVSNILRPVTKEFLLKFIKDVVEKRRNKAGN